MKNKLVKKIFLAYCHSFINVGISSKIINLPLIEKIVLYVMVLTILSLFSKLLIVLGVFYFVSIEILDMYEAKLNKWVMKDLEDD